MPSTARRVLTAVVFLFVINVVACSSNTSSGSQSIDGPPPGTLQPDYTTSTIVPSLSLVQILERTREAMREVTSYKTRGRIKVESSSDNPDDGGTGDLFTAWQSPDRFQTIMESTDSDDGVFDRNVILQVGNLRFFGDGSNEWQEMMPLTDSEGTNPGSNPLLTLLDLENIELTSVDYALDNGSNAYRLEIDQLPPARDIPDGQPPSPIKNEPIHHMLLIDQETFRLVHQTTNYILEFETTKSFNRVRSTEFITITQELTYEFYDYNEHVVIEIPSDYKEWVAPAATAKNDPPDPTPTAYVTRNICSNPETAWPGCGMRNEVDVREMLLKFPADAILGVDEDVVIVFASDLLPNVEWPADAFIVHIPTATVAELCYTRQSLNGETANPPYPLRLWGTHMNTMSQEGSTRLNRVLSDELVMEEIRTRAGKVQLDCEFID